MPRFDHEISSSTPDNETSGVLLLVVRCPLSRGMRRLSPNHIRIGKHLCMRSFLGFDPPFSSSRPRSRAAPYRWKGSYKQQQHRCGKQRKVTFVHLTRDGSMAKGVHCTSLGFVPTSTTLSQQLSISSLSWVITRMVLPFRASLFSFSATRRIFYPSRPLVGSSRIRILRPEKMAQAMARRCFCPPDRADGCASLYS